MPMASPMTGPDRPFAQLAIAAALAVAATAMPACAGDETAPPSAAKEGSSVSDSASAGAMQALEAFIAEQNIDKSQEGWKNDLPKPPKATFANGENYYWVLDTNHGSIKLKLMPDVAPMHVSSTIYLTQLGFYDDIVFHRVIPGFMAQGGDPTGSGRGGPGYRYDGEFDRNAKHDEPGTLSMANAGPGTDGSQFFLTFTETPHLDGRHTVFGRVVEGQATLKELEKRGSRSGRTSETLKIRKASILVE